LVNAAMDAMKNGSSNLAPIEHANCGIQISAKLAQIEWFAQRRQMRQQKETEYCMTIGKKLYLPSERYLRCVVLLP